jgi:hypothetical protein
MRYPILSMALLSFLLAGCAELNSIHRVQSISDKSDPLAAEAKIVTVDAKQRHLLINPILPGTGDVSGVKWRMCAEAAPDVFSAYAASGALEGNKSGGKFGFSGSETAATIERTQTVNLLRESMYRTCERYLSGAIDKTTFIVQAARDQRSMVAVLAVEQLTGAVKGNATIISGPATSANVIDGQQAAKLVQQYSDGLDQAKLTLSLAGSAVVEADKKGKCLNNESKPDGVADSDWASCVAAKSSKAQAEADKKAAQSRLDKMLDMASDLTNRINSQTLAGTNESEAFSARVLGEAAIIAVANAVAEIAKTPSLDEPLMFCIAYLSTKEIKEVNAVISTCIGIIQERATQDLKSRLGASPAPFTQDAAGKKISNYLNDPQETTERQRRMGLVRKAAHNLGMSDDPLDIINFLATGDPLTKSMLQQMIAAIETDEKSKAEVR